MCDCGCRRRTVVCNYQETRMDFGEYGGRNWIEQLLNGDTDLWKPSYVMLPEDEWGEATAPVVFSFSVIANPSYRDFRLFSFYGHTHDQAAAGAERWTTLFGWLDSDGQPINENK